MDPSQRVWKWVSAIVAVVCAALVAANLLLTRGGDSPAEYADWTKVRSHESGVRSQERDGLPDAAESESDSAPARIGGETPPLQPIQTPKSKIGNPRAPSPESRTPEVITPLGLIEQADGRLQAVIPDGEWVQIVEEGQVLTDHTRVAKITAEGVEVVRQADAPAPELARAQGERLSSEPEEGALGFVRHADGRREAVVADGQWVKVILEESVAYTAETTSVSAESMAVAQGSKVGPSEVSSEPVGAVHSAAATGWSLQETVEPIGIVEWADGRTQAVVAQGDSIELVSDAVAVAATRRLLELLQPLEADSVEFALSAGPLARPPEDEVAWLAPWEGDANLRAPPEDEQDAATEPEQVARGQPGTESLAEGSRPPPEFRVGENGLWEADLPGIEDARAASIEQVPPIEYFRSEMRDHAERAGGEGPLAETRQEGLPHGSSVDSGSSRVSSGKLASDGRAEMVEPLGFVNWPDGHEQAVILFHGMVVLVTAGSTLVDGSCVVEAGPGGVAIEPALAGEDCSRAGSPSTKVKGVEEGHPQGPVSQITDIRESGGKLKSGLPLQDNQGQPRE